MALYRLVNRLTFSNAGIETTFNSGLIDLDDSLSAVVLQAGGVLEDPSEPVEPVDDTVHAV